MSAKRPKHSGNFSRRGWRANVFQHLYRGDLCPRGGGVGEGGWHEAMVLVCLPLAAPIGLSPLYIPIVGGNALECQMPL